MKSSSTLLVFQSTYYCWYNLCTEFNSLSIQPIPLRLYLDLFPTKLPVINKWIDFFNSIFATQEIWWVLNSWNVPYFLVYYFECLLREHFGVVWVLNFRYYCTLTFHDFPIENMSNCQILAYCFSLLRLLSSFLCYIYIFLNDGLRILFWHNLTIERIQTDYTEKKFVQRKQ